MYRNSRGILVKLFCLAITLLLFGELGNAQNSVGAVQPKAVSILDTTKEQDGLIGSIRRVKTESAKIEQKNGSAVEGPRQLLELTTYNVKGSRIENISYPSADSLVGKEEYKYDKRGNIVEMTLRDDKGMIINREAYSYEFDSIGNWTKMVTSLVLFENGELKQEPVEITYRTLTYYFDDSIAKIVDPTGAKVLNAAPAVAEFRPTTFETVKVDSNSATGVTSASMAVVGNPPTALRKRESSKTAEPEKIEARQPAMSTSVVATQSAGSSTKSAPLDTKSTNSPAAVYENTAVNPRPLTAPPDPNAANVARLKAANEFYQSGLAKYEAGDLKAAVSAYLESLKLEPGSAEVLLNLGLSYLRLEKEKEAIKAFSESVKLNPTSTEGHYGLGLASFRMHRYRDAANSFKKAISINPNMSKAHYGLALAYEELDEQNQLMEEFRILEKLDKELAKKLIKTFPQIPFTCRYTQLCQ